MAQSIKNVAIIGASGNLGAPILQSLINSSAFNITVLTRLSSNAVFPSVVSVRKTDFTESDLQSALSNQDAVISAVGAGGFAEQKKIIDAAVHAGVKRYLPSEFGVNTMRSAVRELVPLFELKKQALDYLKTKERDGMSWTGIAVGPLLDWGLKTGLLGFNLQENSAVIWNSGNKRFSTTNLETIGEAVVSVLQRPNETANQYLYIASVTTTQNEILDAVQKATGKTWTVENTSTETQVQKGRDLVAEGSFSGYIPLVLASSYGEQEGLNADFEEEETLANVKLGLTTETLQATIEEVVKSV